MTIILDGGGGCGKATLAVDVTLPLQETYFGVNGVLRRAPSNKPARLIGGRTMHSSQGLTPESSMRTHNLALNTQSRQKLAITIAEAGAMHLDEYSNLQGELNNAAALRTTYAREAKFGFNRNVYHTPPKSATAELPYSHQAGTTCIAARPRQLQRPGTTRKYIRRAQGRRTFFSKCGAGLPVREGDAL